jgi:hypothetical protein
MSLAEENAAMSARPRSKSHQSASADSGRQPGPEFVQWDEMDELLSSFSVLIDKMMTCMNANNEIIDSYANLYSNSVERWDRLLELTKIIADRLCHDYELSEEDAATLDEMIDHLEQGSCEDKMPAKKEKASHLRLVE